MPAGDTAADWGSLHPELGGVNGRVPKEKGRWLGATGQFSLVV
jgi:hypothetical protein